MKVVGLTGGIAMGKSLIAEMFVQRGIAVCSADAIVHQLLDAGGEAESLVSAAFPDAVEDGHINRQRLGKIIFADDAKRRALESIVHPLVQKKEEEFVRVSTPDAAFVVLEIPLLFEVGADQRCDVVITASCRPETQRMRALAREGMTDEKLDRILAAQWDDTRRRARADFIVDTDGERSMVEQQVDQIIEALNA